MFGMGLWQGEGAGSPRTGEAAVVYGRLVPLETLLGLREKGMPTLDC